MPLATTTTAPPGASGSGSRWTRSRSTAGARCADWLLGKMAPVLAAPAAAPRHPRPTRTVLSRW